MDTAAKVTTLDEDTRLRLKLAKVAETLHSLAGLVKDPSERARLQAKAEGIKTRAREL